MRAHCMTGGKSAEIQADKVQRKFVRRIQWRTGRNIDCDYESLIERWKRLSENFKLSCLQSYKFAQLWPRVRIDLLNKRVPRIVNQKRLRTDHYKNSVIPSAIRMINKVVCPKPDVPVNQALQREMIKTLHLPSFHGLALSRNEYKHYKNTVFRMRPSLDSIGQLPGQLYQVFGRSEDG